MSREKRLDWKFLFIGVILIVVLIVSAIINSMKTNESATKLAGSIDIDNGDSKINWERYETVDIDLKETVNISKSGNYHLTGTLEDGLIYIDVGVGEVRLILDNVSIKNSSGPAILCQEAEDLVIELIGENTLEDSAEYLSDYDEDVTGLIYSKADLSFGGTGILNLKANHEDAIVGKDDMKFNNGSYNIEAVDDGIRGKDSVYVVGGEFNIEATADAIKSTNETDLRKGFVLIENGTFNLNTLAKAIKSINTILIYNGNFIINSYDDAIHSNNYVGIINGQFNISSGDDGIHADSELIIDGGNIEITKAYEGLEAKAVTINGGKLSLVTLDDGINSGGGADSSAMNRPGAGAFDVDEDCVLSINGGELYVNASGDGVDSNGYLYFNGGKVTIDGPTSNGNGALDSTAGIIMNGGEVIAVGSSGMANNLGKDSSVFSLSVFFSSVYPAGTKIEIKNSKDEIIVEHVSAKSFNHVAFGSSHLLPGETYTIFVDNNEYEIFTISEVVTVIGNNNSNQNISPKRR